MCLHQEYDHADADVQYAGTSKGSVIPLMVRLLGVPR